MESSPSPSAYTIRALLADSRGEYVLDDTSAIGAEITAKVRQLKDARAEAVKRISHEKGYDAKVQNITDLLASIRSVLLSRGVRPDASVRVSMLEKALHDAKKERIANLHDDPDVRQVFDAYFAAETPLREHFSRARNFRSQ